MAHYGEMLNVMMMMREEKVTINILKWLDTNGWEIICYDFPQSGTGILIHPNSDEKRESKNKGGIIPDIIAVKDSIALFFENKDRFVLSDFEKIKKIKTSGNYSQGLDSVLSRYKIQKIYFGIGIPAIDKEVNKSLDQISGIDFLISTDAEMNVYVNHDLEGIFS